MKVLISLSSFGAAETGRHGQLWCTDLAQQAGADGVEVRGELLRDAATELPALAGRAAVYSSPEGLWTPQGALDEAALARGVQAAQVLRAPRLKMSIGGFGSPSHASLHRLQALLQAAPEIYFPDPAKATAGIHFHKVLQALGLADDARKLKTYPNGATAMAALAQSGEQDAVGCTQVTEILYTPGVSLVGALPSPYQLATTYAVGVSTAARDAGRARRFAAQLAGAATRGLREAAGFAQL